MADQRVNKTAPKGNVETSKERRDRWMKSKIERAGQDDTNVISTKTRNLTDYVNLLNLNDKLMSDCLLSFGSNPKVTFQLLEDIKNRTAQAKEMINEANSALCVAMGWTYRPPRGFDDPAERAKRQANKEKQETIQKAAKEAKAAKEVAKETAVQVAATDESAAKYTKAAKDVPSQGTAAGEPAVKAAKAA